jgi:nucleotide-binding universal stress UspA family protein
MSSPNDGLLIVVGVHGTRSSDAAVDWAAREARLRHAALHLVLVRDPAVHRRAPYARPADPGAGEPSAAVLAGAVGRATELFPGGRVTSELADGLPARVLLDRAAGAVLLVLGDARPAGDPADIPGPVARDCLRHAPCPVVIVAQHAPAVPVACIPEKTAADRRAPHRLVNRG